MAKAQELRQQQTAEERNRFARKKEGKRSEKGRVSQLPVGSENSAFRWHPRSLLWMDSRSDLFKSYCEGLTFVCRFLGII